MSQLLDLCLQCLRADAQRILLSGRVDVGEDDLVCQRQRFGKVGKKGLRPRVRVRLEDTPGGFVRKLSGSRQRGRDLRRVMGVVVNDGDAVHFTLMLKPSVGAAIGTKRRGGRFDGNVKQVRQRDGGHCVIDIVFAGNTQREYVFFSVSSHKMKRGTTRRIIGDVCRMVVTVGRRTVSDDLAGKSFGDLLETVNVAAYDQRAVSGQKRCKTMEGAADILNIFKEIQMVLFYIKNDADLREKAQETVGILTGLRDKICGRTHTDIAADRFVDTADGKRRIGLVLQKDLGDHGGGGSLAVGAADGNGHLVIFHHLAQKLRTGQGRDVQAAGGTKLRIVGTDRAGIDDQVDVCRDILRLLAVVHDGALLLQRVCERGRGPVGAGNAKALRQKDLCQTAHADTADADEIYMNRTVEVDLVHGYLLGKFTFFTSIILICQKKTNMFLENVVRKRDMGVFGTGTHGPDV